MRLTRASKTLSGVLCALPLCISLPASAGETGTAQAAFDRLKSLAGTWHGSASEKGGPAMEMAHIFRVSAGGTVVMETMDPGSPDHEMINMYHLDGDELVLTHYCAGNNQPTMRLAQPLPAANEMRFDFTGGTNLDPAKDEHIHGTRLVFVDDDTLESSWTGYKDGRDNGTMTITLQRAE
ncbi:MAG: hypothetical protein AAF657_23850 [Acidobacteriota bacterium]